MAGQSQIVVPIRPLILHRLNVTSNDGVLQDLNVPLVLTAPQATSTTQHPVMVPVRSYRRVKVLVSFGEDIGMMVFLPVGYDSDGAGGYTLVGPLGPETQYEVSSLRYVVASGKFAGVLVIGADSFDCSGVQFVQIRALGVLGIFPRGHDVHLKFS